MIFAALPLAWKAGIIALAVLAVTGGIGGCVLKVKHDAVVAERVKVEKEKQDAINKANPEKLFNDIGKRRVKDYKEKGGYALNAWLKRVEDLGYSIKRNKGKVAIMVLGAGLLAGGIIMYNKNQ